MTVKGLCKICILLQLLWLLNCYMSYAQGTVLCVHLPQNKAGRITFSSVIQPVCYLKYRLLLIKRAQKVRKIELSVLSPALFTARRDRSWYRSCSWFSRLDPWFCIYVRIPDTGSHRRFHPSCVFRRSRGPVLHREYFLLRSFSVPPVRWYGFFMFCCIISFSLSHLCFTQLLQVT